MKVYEQIAERNQTKAREIIRQTGIEQIWQSVGAEVHLVGSLRMGLLVTHKDIDFHIYSPQMNVSDSFEAIARLAENNHIVHVEYTNLLDTPEQCLEWHAWYKDDDGEQWQIDMIHMPAGSRYDGYFERMADSIVAILTDETRDIIMQLKYETPADTKIPGIIYYQSVLRDGVRTYAELVEWCKQNQIEGVIEWIP